MSQNNREIKLMTGTRIPWINGLKGFSCFMIFVHHFMLAFYRASYYGTDAASKTASGIDTRLSTEFYGIVVNGNFYLCIFMVVSAFLFARKILKGKITGQQEDLFLLSLKRYLKLMLPVAVYGIFNYFFIRFLNITGGNYLNKTMDFPFHTLIKHILITQWVSYDVTLTGIFWTMEIFLLGSYIAVFLALVDSHDRWYMVFVYPFIAYAVCEINHYYVGIVLGVWVADILVFDRIKQIRDFINKSVDKPWLPETLSHTGRYLVCLLLIFPVLYLGAYPSYVRPTENLFRFLTFLAKDMPECYSVYHCIAAALLLLVLQIWPGRTIFSTRFFLHLGDLAFAVYMLHMMLIEYLGYYLVDRLTEQLGNYVEATAIVFVVLILLLFLLAEGFHRSVERWCEGLSGAIVGIVEKLRI